MELLQLHNVSLWRNSTIILKNINLTVNTGDQWAVLGPNGSGKSFLMNIIATLVFPSDGQVVIAGETLGEVNVWDVRKHIGIVSDYQQTHYPQETMVAEVPIHFIGLPAADFILRIKIETSEPFRPL